jgi:AcrR family transcriptional regulator
MARPRKDEGRDTRRDILERALDLFAEQGFSGTSTREIARAVGVRESALYHYFPSKDAILRELLTELGPGQVMRLGTLDLGAMLDAMGPEALLRRAVELVVTSWSLPQEQKIFRLMLSEGMRLDAEGVVHPPALLRQGRELIASLFAQLVKRKLVRPVDPHAAALALMGPIMVLRLMYLAMPSSNQDFKGLHAEVERHLTFFWESVRPSGDARRKGAR